MSVNLPGNHKESTQQSFYAMVGTFLGLTYHGNRSESNSIVGSHGREIGASILIIESIPSSWQGLTAPPSVGLWACGHVPSVPSISGCIHCSSVLPVFSVPLWASGLS